MSVIDVQIQSRGVMTAEDLYDFLQSDAEKTVDIDAETGKITAVSEGITKPRIAVNNICNGRDSCLVHSRVPYADFGFSGTGTKTGNLALPHLLGDWFSYGKSLVQTWL